MKTQKRAGFIGRLWKEWRMTIFFIVFVVIPVKSSLADWNFVPTGSMVPTIVEGDLLYVDKIAYDLRIPLTFYRLAKWSDPERGDIVICFSPEDQTRLVKRIIGLPGDMLEMKKDVLYINGRPATYSEFNSVRAEQFYSTMGNRAVLATENLDGYKHRVMGIPSIPALRSFGPVTVPEGSYFVMGDNRNNSKDSRQFGFVERKAIVGKAKAVVVSFDITDKFQPRLKRFLTPLK
jgi:signal peptidase I